jgi:hypothetical protein
MSPTIRRWTPVIAWVVVIYTTIPVVRRLREWFIAHWDSGVVSWLVAAAIVAAALLAALALRRTSITLRRGAGLWIVGAAAVLVAWTFSLRRSPEEAVHFIEYGALAVLLFRALRPTVPGASVFVAGTLIGAMVGTVDEIIQWLTPDRYWDWRDIALNAGAGAIVQLTLWRAVAIGDPGLSTRSLRIVARLAAALLLLVTLCLANTPRVVARYAPLAPWLPHLTSTRNPMAEYGHRHELPGIGRFKSRLDLATLEREDLERAPEVAVVLDDTRHSYGEFLDTWPVADDPFTYEVRVHLFARNRNLGKARQNRFDGAAAREHLTIAWFENKLLEEVVPHTFARSAYVWGPRQRQRVEGAHDPDFEFESAAGSHLITIASESGLRTLLLSLVALIVVADLGLGRYHRGER